MDRIGWSFCIVTAPNNESILEQSIEKIQLEFITDENYEIIIIGNPSISNNRFLKNVKIIPFDEEIFILKTSNIKVAVKEKSLKRLFYRTGAICHKKNLSAENASFDKLCIMHDYIGLEEGWKDGWNRFGNDWKVAMNIILNKDNSRHRDWLNFNYPGVPGDENMWDGSCLMPYDITTKYMYISGTYFCVKKDFFAVNKLDEKLFWGEGEDIEWSVRIQKHCTFKINLNSTVKFLKLKCLDEPPYSSKWQENANKFLEIISKR